MSLILFDMGFKVGLITVLPIQKPTHSKDYAYRKKFPLFVGRIDLYKKKKTPNCTPQRKFGANIGG